MMTILGVNFFLKQKQSSSSSFSAFIYCVWVVKPVPDWSDRRWSGPRSGAPKENGRTAFRTGWTSLSGPVRSWDGLAGCGCGPGLGPPA